MIIWWPNPPTVTRTSYSSLSWLIPPVIIRRCRRSSGSALVLDLVSNLEGSPHHSGRYVMLQSCSNSSLGYCLSLGKSGSEEGLIDNGCQSSITQWLSGVTYHSIYSSWSSWPLRHPTFCNDHNVPNEVTFASITRVINWNFPLSTYNS